MTRFGILGLCFFIFVSCLVKDEENSPPPPLSITAVAGDASAAVSWTASTGDGIKSYRVVTVEDWGKQCTSSASITTCTVTGLTNGTSYTFVVFAINSVDHPATCGQLDSVPFLGNGASCPSQRSAPVMPLAIATIPSAPKGVVGSAGDGQVVVSWTAPDSSGSSPITSYTVMVSSDTTKSCSWNSGPLSCTISGLVNGTAYAFKVNATNAVGTGPFSTASAAVVPLASLLTPGAPTGVTGIAGDAQVIVEWTAPTSNGGAMITSYKAMAISDTAKNCFTWGANSCVVSGLTNGTAYTFTVKAVNSVGTGPASAPSSPVTPFTPSVPGVPTAITATRGVSQITVSWTAPTFSGSSAITGFKVMDTADSSKGCATTGATSCIVTTGLMNGTFYSFVVKAKNSVGTGAASLPSNSVTPIAPTPPATVPGAPGAPGTAGMMSSSSGAVTLYWSAPASDGGAAITSYLVSETSGSGKVCNYQVQGLSAEVYYCSIGGLTNGTTYTFTVKAYNAVGYGPVSATSAGIIPLWVPGAPTGLTGAAGNTNATVSWVAPTSTGGSPITSYKVTVVSDTAKSCTWTTGPLSCTITGLTNGSGYTFVGIATNVVGSSPSSTASPVLVLPPSP